LKLLDDGFYEVTLPQSKIKSALAADYGHSLVAAGSLNARSPSPGSQLVGNIAGLLLIVLGGVVMAFAAIRFRETTLDIDAKRPGERLDIALVRCSSCWGPSYSSIWRTRGVSRL